MQQQLGSVVPRGMVQVRRPQRWDLLHNVLQSGDAFQPIIRWCILYDRTQFMDGSVGDIGVFGAVTVAVPGTIATTSTGRRSIRRLIHLLLPVLLLSTDTITTTLLNETNLCTGTTRATRMMVWVMWTSRTRWFVWLTLRVVRDVCAACHIVFHRPSADRTLRHCTLPTCAVGTSTFKT